MGVGIECDAGRAPISFFFFFFVPDWDVVSFIVSNNLVVLHLKPDFSIWLHYSWLDEARLAGRGKGRPMMSCQNIDDWVGPGLFFFFQSKNPYVSRPNFSSHVWLYPYRFPSLVYISASILTKISLHVNSSALHVDVDCFWQTCLVVLLFMFMDVAD